jgi:putative chitinase
MIKDWGDFIHAVCPNAREDIVEGIDDLMPELSAKIGLTTKDRVCHWVGQLAEESLGFSRLEESLTYTTAKRLCAVWPKRFPTAASATPFLRNPKALAEKVYGGRMGNRPGTADAWDFRGGGLIMLTGRDNYEEQGLAGKAAELRKMPGALYAACAFWKANGLNQLADRGMSDAAILAVTKRVNGGTVGLEGRETWTRKARKLIDRHWESSSEPGHEDGEGAASPAQPAKRMLSKAEVAGLQKRLKEIGYHEVGEVDGLWGGKTRGALAAFQTDKGIRPVTGQTDPATLSALQEPFVRPVSEKRLLATTSTLAAEGNVAAKESLRQKAGAWLAGAFAGIVAFLKFLLENFLDAKNQVQEWAANFDSVPLWLVLAVAGGLAFWWWYSADRAARDLVEAKREGRLA